MSVCGFSPLGSNYTLKDKKLMIEADNLLFAIKKVEDTATLTPSPFEPAQKGSIGPQMEPSYVLSPNVFARLGFEPRYTPPEGVVLPLDDLAIAYNCALKMA